jgi:hypothetical protein
VWIIGALRFLHFPPRGSNITLPRWLPAAARDGDVQVASATGAGPKRRASFHPCDDGTWFLLALVFSMIPWTYSRFLNKMLKQFPAINLVDPSAWDAGPIWLRSNLVGMAVVGYFGLHKGRRAGYFGLLVWHLRW